MITTKLYSDLILITPENGGAGEELKEFSLCKNEPFSFQMAYKYFPEEGANPDEQHFYIRLNTDLDISVYHVNCVPVTHSFSRIKPSLPIGLYPDILMPKATSPRIVRQTVRGGAGFRHIEEGEKISLAAYSDSWKQIWFTVNENEAENIPGKHEVGIDLYDLTGKKVGESTVVLDVIDADLPEQSLYYTNWFHNDCLADFYDLELFSDEYFKVMKDFLITAVKNGMNMVLMPAFTPALDTAIGEERMTVQLVKVKKENGGYTFDFSMMKRYIDVAREAGIKYFEHSHFFTQWGAAHAPKVVAEIDGKTEKIFGWETDASGDEYAGFLRAYIPEMLTFLKGEGLDKTTLFHISDEPAEEHLDTYMKSGAIVRELLDGYTVGDALSDYKFYESGLVTTPIARIHKAMDFVNNCDDLWIYYTGGECYDGLSNRLIQLPRERNRALGYMLYYYNAKGFLHWGYNYYYGRLAHGLYDPALEPNCGFPNAGTTYSVYPGRDRKPLQSIHQKIFADGLVDMRALQLLEGLIGKERCNGLIDEYMGTPNFFNTPETPEKLMTFRKAVNDLIKQNIK